MQSEAQKQGFSIPFSITSWIFTDSLKLTK